MEKLMSMVAFVKEYTYVEGFPEIILEYANFLSQKLELWMFVPCKFVDGVWVVLEEPKAMNYEPSEIWNKTFENELKAYQEAKELVLFEGFTYNEKFKIFHYGGGKSVSLEYLSSLDMEKLVYFELTLTKSAKKQIGL